MGLGFTGAAGGGDVRRPQARGDTSLKQRRRVRAKLPPRLTFCPTLRHEGQIKIRRGGNRITPRTCWHLARPWKSSVCLVTVFTQPAGHTAHSGLPGQSGWSLGPPVPKAPASAPLPASTPALEPRPSRGLPNPRGLSKDRGSSRNSPDQVSVFIYFGGWQSSWGEGLWNSCACWAGPGCRAEGSK